MTLRITDNFITVATLSHITNAVTRSDINKRLEGHTVERNAVGHILSIDSRAIAFYPAKYFFADGYDLDGKPDETARALLKLLAKATS